MATHLTVLRIFLLASTFGGSFAQNIQKELRTKGTDQDNDIRLGYPMRAKSVDPSRVVQLSWQPRVFLHRDFLSEQECDYLIYSVHGKRSNTASGGDSINSGIPIGVDDDITKTIEERISAWTFLPKANSKSFSILHFVSEDSKQKYNYFHNESEEQVGQPLLATVILYLSNVSEGGQILFPQSENKMWSDCTKSNIIFEPRNGNAIVFFNLHLNATPDRTSFHARCPVIRGDLWCATKTFYLKELNAENDMSQSDGSDCTDEDENCPRWAAIGECRRNSVFMIGSPDYYGTCRKSCNVC